jgi:hypothetical protein
VRRADNLTNFMCRLSRNSGSSTSWNPKGLSRPVVGKLHTIKQRKATWIGHILCRNCLPKYVTEGKTEGGTEVTGRRGKRHKELLDDLKETSTLEIQREKTRSHYAMDLSQYRLQN